MLTKRNAAYLEGREAFHNGRDSSDDPFPMGTRFSYDWQRGLSDAKDEGAHKDDVDFDEESERNADWSYERDEVQLDAR